MKVLLMTLHEIQRRRESPPFIVDVLVDGMHITTYGQAQLAAVVVLVVAPIAIAIPLQTGFHLSLDEMRGSRIMRVCRICYHPHRF
jgi:hypothetical protein